MLTGVILAGSTHRRLHGTAVDLLPIGQKTVIARQIREMERICEEVMIVTPEPRLFLEHVPRSVRILTDYYPNKGPLGGLHAAFTLSKSQQLWVTGSGMPFVSSAVAGLLKEHMQVFGYASVMPEIQGKRLPLHGLFRRSCLPVVSELLDASATTATTDNGWDMFLAQIPYGTVEESLLVKQFGDINHIHFRIKTENDYKLALDYASIQEESLQ